MTKAVATTQRERFKTEIRTGSDHILIADESFEDGGRDSGGTPTELLAASLASCSSITMKMYADRKEWPMEEAKVSVEFKRDRKEGLTTFYKKVEIKGNLDDEQRRRIFEISKKCPVHRILLGDIDIESEFISKNS